MSKKKRLGKGLSALMSTPMPVEVVNDQDKPGLTSQEDAAAHERANSQQVDVSSSMEGKDMGRTSIAESDNTHAEQGDPEPSVSQAGLNNGASSESNGVHDGVDEGILEHKDSVIYILCKDLSPNRYQPRQHMDEHALKELAASIQREGLMQPIVARESSTSGLYEIVAGERRWRAAQIANLKHVPVLVRDLDDQRMAEWAIVENLQREDLNAMDQAEAFGKLVDVFQLSHEEIADRVGKSRSAITNYLRLLDLPQFIQEAVRKNLLSNGHARALLAIPDDAARNQIAEKAIRDAWSVRQTEKAIKSFNEGIDRTVNNQESKSDTRQAHLNDVAKQISDQLGSKVQIKSGRKKGSGKLTIEFYDLDHFDNLVERLGLEID